jgi:hypothetical protein
LYFSTLKTRLPLFILSIYGTSASTIPSYLTQACSVFSDIFNRLNSNHFKNIDNI